MNKHDFEIKITDLEIPNLNVNDKALCMYVVKVDMVETHKRISLGSVAVLFFWEVGGCIYLYAYYALKKQNIEKFCLSLFNSKRAM